MALVGKIWWWKRHTSCKYWYLWSIKTIVISSTIHHKHYRVSPWFTLFCHNYTSLCPSSTSSEKKITTVTVWDFLAIQTSRKQQNLPTLMWENISKKISSALQNSWCTQTGEILNKYKLVHFWFCHCQQCSVCHCCKQEWKGLMGQ